MRESTIFALLAGNFDNRTTENWALRTEAHTIYWFTLASSVVPLLILFLGSPGRGVDCQADDEEEKAVEHTEDRGPALVLHLRGPWDDDSEGDSEGGQGEVYQPIEQ